MLYFNVAHQTKSAINSNAFACYNYIVANDLFLCFQGQVALIIKKSFLNLSSAEV